MKKLRKGDGAWALDKDLLGFDFNGDNRTVILDAQKRDALLTKLKDWTRAARRRGKSSVLVLSSQSFGKSFANCEMQQSEGLLSEASTLASLKIVDGYSFELANNYTKSSTGGE